MKMQCTFKMLCRISLLVFFILFLILATLTRTNPAGESDDYMLSAISLENRFSLKIIQQDVEQARFDFPEHYSKIASSWDNRERSFISIKDGIYPWYFGTYSFFCLPMKFILRFLDLNQSYAFSITNILIYFFALLIIFKNTEEHWVYAFFAIALLIFAPVAIFYFAWPSAEIFIASLLIIAAVYLLRSNYYIAILCASMAATMNVTAIGMALAAVLDFGILLIQKNKIKSISQFSIALFNNLKKIFLLICCFAPFIYCLIYKYYIFGRFEPTAGSVSLNALNIARAFRYFIAYLFDLNYGIFAYAGIPLILFIIGAIVGVFRKDRISFSFFVAFFSIVFMYSFQFHINCGMENIARYNAWSLPIILIYISLHLFTLCKNESLKIFIIILLSISFIFAAIGNIWLYKNPVSRLYFSPQAQCIMNAMPNLYNPLPSTFLSRVFHIDGGYKHINELAFYYNDDAFLRKIYVPHNKLNVISDMLFGDNNEIQAIQEKIGDLQKKGGKDYYYIDLPKGMLTAIKTSRERSYIINSGFLDCVNGDGTDFLIGWFIHKSWGAWSKKKSFIIIPLETRNFPFDLHLTLGGNALLHDKHSKQQFEIFANNELIGKFEYNINNPGKSMECIIPRRIFKDKDLIYIRLESLNPARPFDLGINSDKRRLGFALRRFKLDTVEEIAE